MPAVSNAVLKALKEDDATLAWAGQIDALKEIERQVVWRQLLTRVEMSPDRLRITFNPTGAKNQDPIKPEQDRDVDREMKKARARVLEVPWVLLQRGGRTELQLNGTVAQATSQPNEGLVTALVRAFQWKDDLLAGKVSTVQALAQREGLDRCYVMRLLRLSFLAPDLIEAILMGWQPPELTLEQFRRPIPVEWERQRTYFGFLPTS